MFSCSYISAASSRQMYLVFHFWSRVLSASGPIGLYGSHLNNSRIRLSKGSKSGAAFVTWTISRSFFSRLHMNFFNNCRAASVGIFLRMHTSADRSSPVSTRKSRRFPGWQKDSTKRTHWLIPIFWGTLTLILWWHASGVGNGLDRCAWRFDPPGIGIRISYSTCVEPGKISLAAKKMTCLSPSRKININFEKGSSVVKQPASLSISFSCSSGFPEHRSNFFCRHFFRPSASRNCTAVQSGSVAHWAKPNSGTRIARTKVQAAVVTSLHMSCAAADGDQSQAFYRRISYV